MYLEVFILFCYSITHIAFSCYISLTCLRLASVQVTTTSFIRCHLSLLMQSFHRAETAEISPLNSCWKERASSTFNT